MEAAQAIAWALLTYHIHPTFTLHRVEAGRLGRDLASIDAGRFEC